eukprot:TRINITY_DN54042_c0_g1_i1.p1 TRINITY_DN54042_c0_g1~~TRINITY_DN54042_c0_g1_i1.p1  ORF type:complete len:397 (+),score=47.19 TRINITY_DN54042_c0_g1_i1:35-1192(+)
MASLISTVALPAAQAVGTILLGCLFGVTLQRAGCLTPQFLRDLTYMTANVFSPCLILSSFGPIASFQVLVSWWPLPVFVTLYLVQGVFAGLVLKKIFGMTWEQCKFGMAVMSFANTVSVGLPLMENLSKTIPDRLRQSPDDTSAAIQGRSVSYIMLTSAVQVSLWWTLGYRWLAKPNPETKPLLAEENSEIEVAENSPLAEKGNQERVVAALRFLRQNFVTPATVSCLAALVIGSIAPLRDFLYIDSPVSPVVTQILDGFGSCNVPSILLSLGAKLARGPQPDKNEMPHLFIAAFIFCRLVILPGLTLGAFLLLYLNDILPADPVLSMCLLVNNMSPTAVPMLLICSLHQHYEASMATLMFYCYLFANVTIALWTAVYLYVLENY